MTQNPFNREKIRFRALSERSNKVDIGRDHISPDRIPPKLPEKTRRLVSAAVGDIRRARRAGRPVMLSFGAHAIKNGLAPVMIELLQNNWITHLATNGAGIIHDWEFAFQGASSEDVRANVAAGTFGIWHETGFNINAALCIGAYEGLGYGESVGALIARQGVQIPTAQELHSVSVDATAVEDFTRGAAALDLLDRVRRFQLRPGFLTVPHPFSKYSVQAAAFLKEIPFTGHPMFGHDIIYTHPMSQGAAIGRTAERDFLSFAKTVSRLSGGVYLSLGSAVMSPMVFEKSLSMAQNLALQEGTRIKDFAITVVDLTPSSWDWQRGEPPETDPAYYLRYLKTFSRMGGSMQYIAMDNRDFLLSLCQALC